jgi:hypothetical protein
MPGQRALEAIGDHEEKGPGAQLVAATVLKIIASSTPRLRYVIGQQAKLVSRLRQFLPEAAFEKGARKTFRLDRE